MDVGLPLGVEVAGHRLERVIARGGMSIVYLAEHLQLQRRVAFKILAPHLAEDVAFRDRFIRESRIAAALDHPNIVTIYDAGEADGLLYISMRYVEGSDLRNVIATTGALDPWRALSILSQIGSALDAAHEEGLVHRDVKPGNILLSHPGTALERSFLSDFGVTKRMDPSTALTRTGQFVGTVDYVAPEQIRAEPVDGRTDVYSVGCVLYECLSGLAPFPRPTDVATIYAHLQDPIPALPDGSFPGMDAVIARALAKSKQDRYPTCSALVEAARSHVSSEAPTAVGLSLAERVSETPPRTRNVRGIAVVGGLLAVTAAVVIGVTLATRAGPSTAGPPAVSVSTSPPTGHVPAAIVWQAAAWNDFVAPSEVAFDDAVVTSRGRVVAAGHADDTSEDAVAWTQRGAGWQRHYIDGRNAPGDQRITGVAQVGSRLVAVGYDSGDAASWFSDDVGSTWRRGTGMTGAPSARGVAQASDGTIWALGQGGVWSSPDGALWKPEHLAAFPDGADVYAVTADGDRLFAVGDLPGADGYSDPAVWMLEGGSWSQITSDAFVEPGSQYLTDVAVDPDGVVVAVGTDLVSEGIVAFVSTDGRVWAKAAVPTGAGPQRMMAVTYLPASQRFVAGGQRTDPTSGDLDAAIWFSEDGATWVPERGVRNTYDLTRGHLPLEIRSLVPDHAPGVDMLAFGIAGSDTAARARLWIGLLAGGR